MTKQELNRDVKRLHKDYLRAKELNNNDFFKVVDTTIRNEFLRLYHADNNFSYMNKQSILIMLRINISHKFTPFHLFGINITL